MDSKITDTIRLTRAFYSKACIEDLVRRSHPLMLPRRETPPPTRMQRLRSFARDVAGRIHDAWLHIKRGYCHNCDGW